jgi:hypothetical protein
LSRRLCRGSRRSSRRIQNHCAHGRPIAGSTAPPFWVCIASPSIELVAATEDIALPAAVTLIRCDIADGTVAIFEVVPRDEALDPTLSRSNAGKGCRWVGWGVLQRPEQSLGVRIIVRDVGATERGDYSQPLQCIHDEIQVQVDPSHEGRQPRDVPTPDLVGPERTVDRTSACYVRSTMVTPS